MFQSTFKLVEGGHYDVGSGSNSRSKSPIEEKHKLGVYLRHSNFATKGKTSPNLNSFKWVTII